MGLSEFLFGKQRAIDQKLEAYLTHWWQCMQLLEQALTTYLDEGPGEQIDYYYSRVDSEESRGDVMRREIERELYGKALLPESRGDILRILEAMDKVINRAESTIRQLVIERLEIEPWMLHDLHRITAKTVEGASALHRAAANLLNGTDDTIHELVAVVGEMESRCDHIEEDLLGRIFAADLDLARKMQLKDFVRRLATVSDHAETAADMLLIVSIKRRV